MLNEITLLFKHLKSFIPFIITIGISTFVLTGIWYLLYKRKILFAREHRIFNPLVFVFLVLMSVIAGILTLPISDVSRGQLLSLIGITTTGAIGLASTTFIGNAMAGFMLKIVSNFRPGDFLKVENIFGRITEMGLFHTEIQTEDRDLATLSNLYLVKNPVKVIRSSGAFISSEISIGYDVSSKKVQTLLLEAAESTGLAESFVHIKALGDFSVSYKVSGFLKDIKTILSSHSKLKGNILEIFHKNNVEIVSPNFMNQRQLVTNDKMIPKGNHQSSTEVNSNHSTPEDLIFDKADEAETKEKRKERLEEYKKVLGDLEKEKKEMSDEVEIEKLVKRIERIKGICEKLEKSLNEKGEK